VLLVLFGEISKMKYLLLNFWNDDDGALIATEFLFITVIIVIGLVVGLVYVRNATTAKLSELAQAILLLDVSYQFSTLQGENTDTSALSRVNGTTVTNTRHTTEFPGASTTQISQAIFDSAATTQTSFSAFAR
jgi:Flp pilus assembly pilin Flp